MKKLDNLFRLLRGKHSSLSAGKPINSPSLANPVMKAGRMKGHDGDTKRPRYTCPLWISCIA